MALKRTLIFLAVMFIAIAHGVPAMGLYSNSVSTSLSRISDGNGGGQSNFSSKHISFSGDGRYVVFESDASNLVGVDTNGATDIFLYDTDTSTMTKVSNGLSGAPANGSSFEPMISDDGSAVVFASYASNLVANDTNGKTDVFLYAVNTGVITRVSVDSSGNQGDDHSAEPSISQDGSVIAFTSLATNITTGDTNAASDVFVRNVSAGTTSLVSVSTAGAQGNKVSFQPRISANGSYIAFSSDATNLSASDTNSCTDVFVRDLANSITTLVSSSSSGVAGNRSSTWPAISSDGHYIVFQSRANNLVASDINGYVDIFMKDMSTGTTTLISKTNSGAQVTYDSTRPSISFDGRFVTFESRSPDYVPWDSNNASDVFIHDNQSGRTAPFSTLASSVIGNKKSYGAVISGLGGKLGFLSLASNLVTPDTNSQYDVFVRSNPFAGQVVNITSNGNLTETGGTQNAFTLTRFGDTGSSLTVSYTVSGTAASGADYTALSGTVTIPSGSSTVTIPVTTIVNTTVDPQRTIVLTLSDNSEYMAGAFDLASTQIIDDDTFTVEVFATHNVATKNGSQTGLFTISRTSGGTYGDLVVTLARSGTATNGIDYTGFSTPVIIPNGQASTTLLITGIPNTSVNGDRTIIASVASSSAYNIGTSGSATIALRETNSYTVTVAATDAIARKDNISDTATFRITRDGNTNDPLVVSYNMRGSATNGVDYNSLSGAATIPAGATYVDVVVTAISGSSTSQGAVQTAVMELLEGPLYSVGNARSAVVLIQDPGSAPIVSVAATAPTASEDGTSTGQFTITRAGSTGSSLTVYFSYGGTARVGTNYSTTATSSVTIPSGSSSATITIAGIHDGIPTDTLTTVLAISAQSSYAVDPVLSRATVSILDVDTQTIAVTASALRASKNGFYDGKLTFTRIGSLNSPLTVNFSVSGTATSGTDFSSIGTSATFGAGESRKDIAIHALANSTVAGPQYVEVQLQTGSDYAVGAISRARVDIVDNTHSVMKDILHIAPNGDIRDISMANDGRYVAFASDASNLVSGDTNNFSDIFIADLTAGAVVRIMAAGAAEPNGPSDEPKISADGRYIVFSTKASNFVGADLRFNKDIVLFDRVNGTYQIVNGGPTGIAAGGDSFSPYISSSGSYIVFASYATNLIASDTNATADIFLYKRSTGVLTRASYTTAYGQFTHDCLSPSVSDDGRLVVFETKEHASGDTDSFFDVVAVDQVSGAITRVSKPLSGNANDGDSRSGRISADGSKIGFVSAAKTLVANDLNNATDTFVSNLADGSIIRTSSTALGVGADMPSRTPSISFDGRFNAFISTARNLSSEFNCTTTALIKDASSGGISAIDYQSGLECKPPLYENVISRDGRLVLSSIVSDQGIRDLIISSNPLWR